MQVRSLYADELDSAQFHIPLLGPPIPPSPLFHTTSQGSLIYQLSKNGILGAIRPADGEIIWRQSVPGAEYFALIDDEISILAKSGIRVFNAISGHFVRNVEIFGDKMIVCNNQLVILDNRSSSVKAGTTTWFGDPSINYTHLACHGDYLLVHSLNKDGLSTNLLDSKTLIQNTRFELPQLINEMILGVNTFEFSAGEAFLSLTADSESRANEVYIHHSGSTFVVHQKTGTSAIAEVYLFNKKTLSMSKPVTLPDSDLNTIYTVSTVNGDDYVVSVQAAGNSTLARIFSSSGIQVAEHSISTPLSPKYLKAQLSFRPDKSLVPRLLITTTHSEVHFIRESSHLWSRPDYLSDIQKAAFVTLPTTSTALLKETFLQRLMRHFSMIDNIPKTFFVSKIEQEKHLYGRKYIITATSSGILTAIDTLGTIVWTHRFSGTQVRDLWVDGTEAFLVTEWGVNVFDAVLGIELRQEKFDGQVVKTNGGYMVIVSDDSLKLNELWYISFPSAILAISTPPSHKIASIGRVNPDRSVHYKYLNPHLLLIASGSNSILTITYIDSVAGTILRQITHSEVDLSKPLCLTTFENVVVYTYFSTSQARGWTVTIHESFESIHPDTHNEGLFIEQKSFLLAHPIKKLWVTQTRLGITQKEIIGITDDNSVILFPRQFLDSRRTDQKAEGVLPYDAVIPDDRKWIVSHSLQLLNATEIVTEPTMLESTGLIFIFGNGDLFFTRATPSGGFDVLSKSFNKGMLLCTILGLIAAIGMTGGMVKKRKEDLLWGI
ncbi:ER membrane protein complex subunit 1 [Neolecta irregularis DAH-3]|uniref:ER membrane protein complex subunit 1 n=1 Tax=Neolecta irregularis (strain DAH-3) TaxID=1198029 RepID=A0A1U7LPH7_NEOID|nr:ER membrane protein complex subunit 1 [Neolecta irregularis DAH-3]|eukprot:OLL24554.1 ER membrane protein complex subunit 1 [Neolecta irregularis DAH-3]